jgi:hypothetical protein
MKSGIRSYEIRARGGKPKDNPKPPAARPVRPTVPTINGRPGSCRRRDPSPCSDAALRRGATHGRTGGITIIRKKRATHLVGRFHIPIRHCGQCQKGVQGRHQLQTFNAIGAAAVQAGLEAITRGVSMNKAQGLPHAGTAPILKQVFELTMNRSGNCRTIQRVAGKAESTWYALRDAARRSVLGAYGRNRLEDQCAVLLVWGVVARKMTDCEILAGRGFAQASSILRADYVGWLLRDGLHLYYEFLEAAHQSCAWHFIPRCKKMVIASPATAGFAWAVIQLLEQGPILRDQHLEGKIPLQALWMATGRLDVRLARLLKPTQHDALNRRLAKHLRHERPYLFTFLNCPGLVDATINVAEWVIRILVIISNNGMVAEPGSVRGRRPFSPASLYLQAAGQGYVCVCWWIRCDQPIQSGAISCRRKSPRINREPSLSRKCTGDQNSLDPPSPVLSRLN